MSTELASFGELFFFFTKNSTELVEAVSIAIKDFCSVFWCISTHVTENMDLPGDSLNLLLSLLAIQFHIALIGIFYAFI